jgi:hypothetical protein
LHSYSVTFNDDLTANEEVQIAFPSFKLESAITPGTLLNLKAPPSLRFANFAPADTTNWIAILTATVESLLDVGEDTASVTISATSAEGVQTHAVTCTLNKKITTLSELMNIDYINVTFDGISSIELHFTAAHAATNLSTGDLGITVSSTATAQYLLNIQ